MSDKDKYECPVWEDLQAKATNIDDYLEKWTWHHTHCTCGIVELYIFSKLAQDDHIRAYWEHLGKLKIRWDVEYGMLLEYHKDLCDMIEINYPYY